MEVLGLLIALAVWFFVWKGLYKKGISMAQSKAKGHFIGASIGFLAFVIIVVIAAVIIVPKDPAATSPATEPAEEVDLADLNRKAICLGFAKKYSDALERHYRWNIYGGAVCDTKIINDEIYIYCHKDNIGGLYIMECDGENYQVFAVNGKAMQHSESDGVNVERFTEYRDIPAILEQF